MSKNGQQHPGVTKPISLSGPSDSEVQASEEMMNELRKRNTFESEDEAKNRESILDRISKLAKQFVYRASIQNGQSKRKAAASGGKIFIFGSYQLGVHGPGVDIDALLVVPKHVSRDDFFRRFGLMLKELESVTEVEIISEAFVPIIKAKISGIEIDILCARVGLASVPDNLDLSYDSVLANLDKRCIRSLGGPRVTDEILRLVPNVDVFRDALRCIRFWAKRRAIYSKNMGFLGGVAWAVLVARVCQLYPNQCSGVIVQKFFVIMQQWSWPQPVLLKKIEGGPLNFRLWDPKIYPADRTHLMPIIAPAYPASCLAEQVTYSTRNIITQELKRGNEIVRSIMKREAEWSELFTEHNFFSRYRYYLQVVASSSRSEALSKWSGIVGSKIRQLVTKLELVGSLTIAHPFLKKFNHGFRCTNDAEVLEISTGKFIKPLVKGTPEDLQTPEDSHSIWTASFFIGLEIAPKPAGTVGPRKLDITCQMYEFKRMLEMWDGYNNNTMAMHVLQIKSAQLPSYVFEGGIRQLPRKRLKRSKLVQREKPENFQQVMAEGFPIISVAKNRLLAGGPLGGSDDSAVGDSDSSNLTFTFGSSTPPATKDLNHQWSTLLQKPDSSLISKGANHILPGPRLNGAISSSPLPPARDLSNDVTVGDLQSVSATDDVPSASDHMANCADRLDTDTER